MKARAQAQVRPVSERVLERERKRVEVARQTTVKARESLAEGVAAQEKQEGLLADGEQRLSQLVLEEKNNLSFFTVPPPPVDASVSNAGRRVNGVGPRSLLSLRIGVGVDRRGPREARPSRRREWDRCRVHARHGLRGSRVGEASNPGPSFLRLRRGRSATVNIGVDSGQFSASTMLIQSGCRQLRSMETQSLLVPAESRGILTQRVSTNRQRVVRLRTKRQRQ